MSCVHVNSGDHAAQVPGPFEASCVRERATAVFIILVVARQSKQRLTDAVDVCMIVFPAAASRTASVMITMMLGLYNYCYRLVQKISS